MKDDRSKALTNAVEAISDGKPVDWDSTMKRHPEISPLLENLRDIESLMRTFSTATEAEKASQAPAQAPEEYVTQWGHLRKLRFIGEGAFGKVYRAFDPMLEQDVALKLWNKSVNGMELDVTEMLSEARKLAKVHHPNVLVVHGADRHDGRAGMWTEFLDGETLEAQLKKVGKFSAREAKGVGIDLCGAIAAIHKAGLVHRDVKTFNVMRTTEGKIVLMDFGSVGELSKSGMLRTSTNRGTPLTMSPEQLQGGSVGPTADIYSLGVLLYHLVTAEYPIEARSIEELAYRHASGSAVPLIDRRPDLPANFVRVVEKAMAVDPSERYPSAGAMEKALDAALANPEPVPEPPLPWWAPLRKAWTWLVARPARWASAVGAVVVVAAAAFFFIPPAFQNADESSSSAEPSPLPDGSRTVGPPQSGAPIATQEVPPPANVPQDPVAVAIPAPARTVAFTVDTNLYRVTPDGDERLLPGARIAPRDALWLEIEGNRAMYVYVFNEDEAGAASALFPGKLFDTKNPLHPGRVHRLPGTSNGRAVNWSVSSAAGRETYFVIASTKPREELDQLVINLRSTKDIVPSTRPLQPVLDKLPQAAADPWVWRIDLENPPGGS